MVRRDKVFGRGFYANSRKACLCKIRRHKPRSPEVFSSVLKYAGIHVFVDGGSPYGTTGLVKDNRGGGQGVFTWIGPVSRVWASSIRV